jgi:hypothetical protein
MGRRARGAEPALFLATVTPGRGPGQPAYTRSRYRKGSHSPGRGTCRLWLIQPRVAIGHLKGRFHAGVA